MWGVGRARIRLFLKTRIAMLSTTLIGVKEVTRHIKASREEEARALNLAIRVEGFRLMKAMKAEIRRGAPGGRRLKPLSEIGRRSKAGYLRGERDVRLFGARRLNRAPLERLASLVRYAYVPQDQAIHVGFLRHGPQLGRRGLSGSWVRIIYSHEVGGTFRLSAKRRRSFARHGGQLKKRRDSAFRYFFLRKSTRTFKLPARPIVDPFWRARHESAWRNIRRNYRRKLAGHRI